MRLVESRDAKNSVDFKEALLHPSAPGGGLYSPEFLPRFCGYSHGHLSYQDFALKLIESFEFGHEDLFKKALKSYEGFDDPSCPLSLHKIGEKLHLNALYHGPTRAFKDMALQPFGVLLEALARDRRLLILCATSGDTGPATLKSFENSQNVKVCCLYPCEGTSKIQALQMRVMDGRGLRSIALRGDFDAAQRILKNLLASEDFKRNLAGRGYELCAANSVNFGRILFQIIYHYYAAVKIGRELDIIVPSGNFGNALGAYYAKLMGAEIDKIKIASNANNILSEFFNTGRYDLRGKKLIKTISPAMDILVSSNIERLLFAKFGDARTKELMQNLQNEGVFVLNGEELEALREDFEADFCTDEEAMGFIRGCEFLIDPHTATCFKLVGGDKTQVITSTAEWTKFTPSMVRALYGRACVDERADLLGIAAAFGYGVKEEILRLFALEGEPFESYDLEGLDAEILRGLG